MKIFTIIVLLSLSCTVRAQKSIFVRVYDLTGKKINKGHLLAATDTSLLLEGTTTPANIPVHNIGFIKTKRSGGNNVLTGSIIAVSTMAIVGAVTSDPNAGFLAYNAGEGAAGGALIGLPFGAAIGGLTILLKNSKTYVINGDMKNWKVFQLIATGKNIK
jgi:hypothetical protein